MLVSVVIPTHNRPEFLQRAIDSVFAQTFTDYEVIVVDDGDAPSAAQTIAKYQARDNFRYLETAKNQGAPVARNQGIQAAQGTYVAFLDDDDCWLPEKLTKQITLLEQSAPQVAFSFCAATNETERGDFDTNVDDTMRDFSVFALTRFKGFLTPTLVVRRSVLLELGGFDEALPASQEPDLIVRMTRQYQGAAINEPLVRVNMKEVHEHIGGNMHKRIAGREMLLAKHKALYFEHEDLWATHLFRLALMYRKIGNYRRAGELTAASLRYTKSIRRLVHALRYYAISIWSNELFQPTVTVDPVLRRS